MVKDIFYGGKNRIHTKLNIFDRLYTTNGLNVVSLVDKESCNFKLPQMKKRFYLQLQKKEEQVIKLLLQVIVKSYPTFGHDVNFVKT